MSDTCMVRSCWRCCAIVFFTYFWGIEVTMEEPTYRMMTAATFRPPQKHDQQ